MKPDVWNAINEQLTTIGSQFDNAAAALAKGDTAQLEKALAIIEKVARILIIVLGAIAQARAKK